MVNKSFVLKENFYSRQVLTISSIPWKLPLKGHSIVVMISCFFLLFKVESLQKSNRTWFLDISVSQLLCHTRNNTREYSFTKSYKIKGDCQVFSIFKKLFNRLWDGEVFQKPWKQQKHVVLLF